jgi:hypothetical protein
MVVGMKLIALIAVLFISAAALAQTTQPAKLSDLWQPYADRMEARLAELPSVPTDAQIADAKQDCAAIGDEFEESVRLRYVWYAGFINGEHTVVKWSHGPTQSSERERNAKKWLLGLARPESFRITYSAPISGGPGEMLILSGQVLQCEALAFITHDKFNGGGAGSDIVAYPILRAYLNAGNVVTIDPRDSVSKK